MPIDTRRSDFIRRAQEHADRTPNSTVYQHAVRRTLRESLKNTARHEQQPPTGAKKDQRT